MRTTVSALLATLLASGCTGAIDGQGMSDPEGSPGGTTPGTPGMPGPGTPGSVPGTGGATGTPGAPGTVPPSLGALDRDTGPVGAAPLRRLNRREYNNVVRDLLGDTTRPADQWPAESALSGFDTDVGGQAVAAIEVEQFLAAAEQLARNANAALAGCDPALAGEDACGNTFIDRFAARAYRRPLAADQKTRLKTVFDHGRRGAGFVNGIRLVIEAVLQSPYFLYRPELGEPATPGAVRVALTSHEIAARLSFFLLGSQPDDPLRMAADANTLRTPEAVEQQARRLLARPEARSIVATFHEYWLHLEKLDGLTKDAKLYPNYNARMVASMEAGTRALAQHLYLDRGDAPLEELFTAPYAFVDGISARTYGMPTSTSTTIAKVMLKQPRAGLLTDASLMAALANAKETTPVARGLFVREKLLCLATPPPPADAVIEPPKENLNLTTRERYAMHRTSPVCASCHQLIDNIGFGFENYDAVGSYRDMENGKPVDASGELIGTATSDGPYRGAVELGRRLVKAQEIPRCLAESWLTFALGRRADEQDERTVAALSGWLGTPEARLRELLVAITRTPTFRFRPPVVAAP